MALGVIAFKDRLIERALDDAREFPTEVESILNAGVHTLPSDRNVDMGSIPRKKGPILGEAVGVAVRCAIARTPSRLIELALEAGKPDEMMTNLVKSRFLSHRFDSAQLRCRRRRARSVGIGERDEDADNIVRELDHHHITLGGEEEV